MVETKKELSLIKNGILQVIAGGSAGFVEVCIMQPLDVAKTRLQLQSKIIIKQEVYYNGLIDCFTNMYKKEGILSFWKGIVPPIMIETPKRALKFFCFEQYKPYFMFGKSDPTPLTFALAGLGAGLTEAIIVNPFEVIKIAQQADRSHIKTTPSSWLITKQILNNNGFGLNGLNKGITATMSRNGIFNMIYFGFYHSVKQIFPSNENKSKQFACKFLIGFTSGILASIANIPFDVAKSRIQGPQPNDGIIKYKKTTQTICIIAKEEGFKALYKGLTPKILRLGPGGAIMLLIFEYVYDFLQISFL